MRDLLALLMALALATILGFAVPWLLSKAKEPDRPDCISVDQWDNIVRALSAGLWIGILERILFVAALWLNRESLLAAWLTFKLASKWESWKNVVQVPPTLEGLSDLQWFSTRSRLGSWILTKFWLGTLANVLIAGAAVTAGRFAAPYLSVGWPIELTMRTTPFLPRWLTISGLVLDITGAAILWRYGLPAEISRSAAVHIVADQVDKEERDLAARYDRISFLGFLLLVAGFGLQLLGSLVPP